ncbi:hypothetical protein GXW82_03335 [Streptacidiphilus sp. 4-A2]|nr:hypothetical protein [Streptacidiphilus sp. 4-A2]
MQALAEAIEGGDTALTVMDVDWSQMAAVPGMADLHTVRSSATCRRSAGCRVAWAPRPAHRRRKRHPVQARLAQRLAGLSRTEQDRLLTDLIRSEAACAQLRSLGS